MTTLKEHRTSLGLSLEEVAVALGYAATSASWISEIENGKRDASLRLALRIEAWSGGKVSGASVCTELAGHRGGSLVDAPTLPVDGGHGAENDGENITRTAGGVA